MLELKNIQKTYNPGSVSEMTLFNDFNLTVKDSDFISIVGSNGSGKTSLLNIICGGLPIEKGSVIIDGKCIDKFSEYKRYKNIGRVYQNPQMGSCPNMTVAENLSMADNKGKAFNLTKCVSKHKISTYRDMLAELKLGLEEKLSVPMGLLSGGQRQAVSLLMATMTPIDFLILDEHTAALDPHTAEVIMQLTDKIVKEKNLTAIMVTHNLRYAVEYGNRLIMMDKGKVILDKEGEEKKNIKVDDVLSIFNKISIECGN